MGVIAYVHEPIAVQIKGIGKRIVKVNLLRVTGAGYLFYIIAPAHTKGIVKDVGEFERKVGGMKRAKAASGHCDSTVFITTVDADSGNQVADNEVLVGIVAHTAPVGIGAVIKPTLIVQPLRTIKLDFAVVDEVRDGFHHAVIFKVVELSAARWEGDHGCPVVSISEHMEVAANGGAVDGLVASVHESILDFPLVVFGWAPEIMVREKESEKLCLDVRPMRTRGGWLPHHDRRGS